MMILTVGYTTRYSYNLSILDFKCAKITAIKYSAYPYNLSILDFKYIVYARNCGTD